MNDTSDLRDRYTLRNITGFSLVEFAWGVGLPVVLDSTFLQIFLRNLGARNFVIGVIPALYFIGPALMGPFSGFLTAHLARKRRAVILCHLFPSVVLFLFGAYYLFSGNSGSTVPVFLLFYALFSLGIGLMLPVWQNYLGKVFSKDKVVQSIATVIIIQTLAKIVGSFLILQVVKRYSFDQRASALVFLCIGGLFTFGSLFFLLTREIVTGEAAAPARVTFQAHLKRSFACVMANRNYLTYLGGNIEFFTAVAVLSFYANYAVEYRGISVAMASGLFVLVNYCTQLCMNLIFGWKNSLSLKGKCITSHILSLCGIAILILWPALPGFLIAGGLLGSSRVMRNLVYVPAIRLIAGVDDATDFFAAASIITLPVSAALSLFSGRILDVLAFLGEWSYRAFFCGAAVMITVSMFFIIRTDFTGGSSSCTGQPYGRSPRRRRYSQ